MLEVRNRWKPAEKIAIGWTAGAFGDSLCFAALPGEPFVEHQIDIPRESRVPECNAVRLFVFGGRRLGRLHSDHAGVGRRRLRSGLQHTVEVGTGERLIDRAVVKIFQMRGLLKEFRITRY